MSREIMLTTAEVFDSWRLFPRALMTAYCIYSAKVMWYIIVWYSHEPAVARGAEESAVVAAVFTALGGFGSWLFKIYSENGRNWNKRKIGDSR